MSLELIPNIQQRAEDELPTMRDILDEHSDAGGREAVFIDNTLDKYSKNMTIESELLTIYQPQTDDQNPEKTTTFRFKFTDYNKTLSDKDINPVMKKIETLATQNGYKIS